MKDLLYPLFILILLFVKSPFMGRLYPLIISMIEVFPPALLFSIIDLLSTSFLAGVPPLLPNKAAYETKLQFDIEILSAYSAFNFLSSKALASFKRFIYVFKFFALDMYSSSYNFISSISKSRFLRVYFTCCETSSYYKSF